MNKSYRIIKGSEYDKTYYEESLSQWHLISFDTISFLIHRYTRYNLGRRNIVVDLGCGDGHYLPVLENIGRVIIGLDSSTHGLKKIKYGGSSIICSTATLIPIKSESVDLVLCTEVIEHVKDPEKLIRETHRILKHKGEIILTTTTYYFLISYFNFKRLNRIIYFFLGLISRKYRDKFVREGLNNIWEHLHGFTKRELCKILQKNNFDICEIKYFNVQPIINPENSLVRFTLARYLTNVINQAFRNKITEVYGPNIFIYARKALQ